MGLKLKKKEVKDKFKNSRNADNEKSKLKKIKRQQGSGVYICSGEANIEFWRKSYTRIK